jgi:arylsulfatase
LRDQTAWFDSSTVRAEKSILSIDGQKAAEGNIPKIQPFAFSADEGADVDGETNVSTDYRQGDNAFTGKIVKVTVEQK